jgi:hypothetical protein
MNEDAPELVDPLEASRHPFEVYMLVLAAISGAPLLFGKPNSGSIEETLPPLLVTAWGGMLVVGSLLALLGLYWRGRSSTALLMERAGLVGVGGAAVVYAAALTTAGWRGAFAGCLTAGFGLACFAQAHRISQRIRAVIRQMNEYGHDH